MTAAPDRCRKCDAPRPRADQACPRCGLAPEHAEAWAARASLAPTGSLEAAWAEAEAAWEDPAAHERASAAALATNDFAWLAARYRAVLRARPADAIATYRLELLGKRAAAAPDRHRRSARPGCRQADVAHPGRGRGRGHRRDRRHRALRRVPGAPAG
jgi:hypothetical protein